MSFIELGNLNFADEKVTKLQSLLPAVRAARANVLISGPTGAGKSYLAKHILSGITFIQLDVQEAGDEFNFTTFFSHTRAQACLLENIEKLSVQQQKNLFEALESRGEDEKIRLVATSRTALKPLVQKNLFREDLYYRLTVLSLELPALADRSADIEILAAYLLGVFGIIHHKADLVISFEAIEKMKTYTWPGNIREFENVLERAVVLAESAIIQAHHIVIEKSENKKEPVSFAGMTLSEVEQKLILQTLQMTAQNRTRAAEILGISIRTLRNKINEYREAGLV